MKEQENKSIPERILDDFYEALKDKEEFDEFLINKLVILGKTNKLSNQNSIEDLIIPKQEHNENS